MAWERQGQARDQRRENLIGGKGTKAVNQGVGRTYGGLMLRDCQGDGNNQRGKCWGVFCANWNGAARVWGNNERVQGGGIFGHWKDKTLGVREILDLLH